MEHACSHIDRPVEGRQRSTALGWEGVVYGTVEGVLLSALPPFMAWQMIHSTGWTGLSTESASAPVPIDGGRDPGASVLPAHLGDTR